MGNTKRISNLEHRVAALEARTAQEATADTSPATEPEDFGAVVEKVCKRLWALSEGDGQFTEDGGPFFLIHYNELYEITEQLASANGQTLDERGMLDGDNPAGTC